MQQVLKYRKIILLLFLVPILINAFSISEKPAELLMKILIFVCISLLGKSYDIALPLTCLLSFPMGVGVFSSAVSYFTSFLFCEFFFGGRGRNIFNIVAVANIFLFLGFPSENSKNLLFAYSGMEKYMITAGSALLISRIADYKTVLGFIVALFLSDNTNKIIYENFSAITFVLFFVFSADPFSLPRTSAARIFCGLSGGLFIWKNYSENIENFSSLIFTGVLLTNIISPLVDSYVVNKFSGKKSFMNLKNSLFLVVLTSICVFLIYLSSPAPTKSDAVSKQNADEKITAAAASIFESFGRKSADFRLTNLSPGIWKDNSGPVNYYVVQEGHGAYSIINVMSGFNLFDGKMLGVKIISEQETPGIGDRIKQESFLKQFVAAEFIRLQDSEKKKFDCITGATISSKAVIEIVKKSFKELKTKVSEEK
ncbi:MAG: FMN-binding protein [Candidatus Riflebacteria bacterium]|nr:FMN-binding protein [Candidatus Riflebacteria bacterium]